MKGKRWFCLLLVFVLMFSCSSLSASPAATMTESQPTAPSTPDPVRVLEARFLNMLNHNFAYGSDFESEEALVDSAVIALLDYETDSFIPESYVQDYLVNMYGVEIENISQMHSQFSYREGYVYVIPRGYSVYQHVIDSITENEDGSYTVVTGVSISAHDGEIINANAVSLFVKNEKSVFGYQILSSDIIEHLSNM